MLMKLIPDRKPFVCRLHQSEAGVVATSDEAVRDQYNQFVGASLLSNISQRLWRLKCNQAQVQMM